MARRDPDDDVPRLPRGRGFRFSTNEIVRILVVATALVALLVLQKPCARSVSKFVNSFAEVDAGVASPDAMLAPIEGVRLRTDMTPAELQAAIESARRPDAGAALDAGVAITPDAR